MTYIYIYTYIINIDNTILYIYVYVCIYIYIYTARMGVLPGESPPEVYFNCAEAVFLCILGCRAGWPTG